MTYLWETADGTDRLSVQFDLTDTNVKTLPAVAVAGTCGGALIALVPDGVQAGLGLLELAKLPGGDRISRQIEFDGTAFHLAYAANNREDSTRLLEYVPQGQSLSQWHQMLTVVLHTDGGSPADRLEQTRELAMQTGNPHFKALHVAKDGSEAIAAIPMQRPDAVEYQVSRWVTVPGGVQASVYFIRNYADSGVDRDTFVSLEADRAGSRAESLKALAGILPPDLGGNGSLTFTRNGKDDSEVWIDPVRPAGPADI
jgi:hypothetical protein